MGLLCFWILCEQRCCQLLTTFSRMFIEQPALENKGIIFLHDRGQVCLLSRKMKTMSACVEKMR